MRRHVLRVRGVRSDFGVAPGCVESLFRDRWIVVEMDQIMRHTRMLRLAHKNWLYDRRSFELAGVGLVGWRGRGVERQGVVGLRLVIVRRARGRLLHGLGIRLHAAALV